MCVCNLMQCCLGFSIWSYSNLSLTHAVMDGNMFLLSGVETPNRELLNVIQGVNPMGICLYFLAPFKVGERSIGGGGGGGGRGKEVRRKKRGKCVTMFVSCYYYGNRCAIFPSYL